MLTGGEPCHSHRSGLILKYRTDIILVSAVGVVRGQHTALVWEGFSSSITGCTLTYDNTLRSEPTYYNTANVHIHRSIRCNQEITTFDRD